MRMLTALSLVIDENAYCSVLQTYFGGDCMNSSSSAFSALISQCVRFPPQLWNYEGQCMRTLAGHQDAVTCLQFDSTRIVSGSLDCNLKFWDIITGDCINTIDWKAAEGHTGVVRYTVVLVLARTDNSFAPGDCCV